MTPNDIVKETTENKLSFLKGIPFLGGLAGDGVTTSGAAAGGGAVTVILALDIPALAKAIIVASLAAVWMLAGALKSRAGAVLLLVGLSIGATGCGRSAREQVLEEAFGRYADTGESIVPLVKAETPGEKALLDAFKDQIQAVRALQRGR